MAWRSQGLRGSPFEETIDLTNRLYAQQGLALVQKVPTSITPIEVDNAQHTITLAYFEKKSTVDFIGVAQGLAICFDAKETRQSRLPLRNIHAHQIAFMQAFAQQRGVSFLLVRFCSTNEIFLLPIETLARAAQQAEAGGRKSIPYDDFDPALRVPTKDFPVHYLVAINAYLAQRERSNI